jgi:hypothetical protein
MPDPLTPAALAEIEERAEAAEQRLREFDWKDWPAEKVCPLVADTYALLAEVRRLLGENDALKSGVPAAYRAAIREAADIAFAQERYWMGQAQESHERQETNTPTVARANEAVSIGWQILGLEDEMEKRRGQR